MTEDYPTEEPETPKAGEPEIHYDTSGANTAELMYPSFHPRTISDEEIAHSYTLEEFKQHMDDLVESTHNHATGCVELTPVVPRRCSIEDAKRRSMTIDQFTANLYAMVDDYYRAKA